MIMEYAENGSLYSFMKKPGVKLSWEKLLAFTYDTAKGLEALHTHNPPVVHRDLKSLNLLVMSDWRVKVCDFGLSRPDAPDQLVTLYKLCGTCAYCGPEMINGKKSSARSDVYSMGIVVWEMLTVVMTGNYVVPFSEYDLQHQFQILMEASKGTRPSLPPGSPKDIVQLYLDCVNTDPDSRPTSSEVAKRVMKIQAAYKENPSEWANNKTGVSRNKTSSSGTSTPTPRDDIISGESRSSLNDSRPEVSKAPNDSAKPRAKRVLSQPIPTVAVPAPSSDRLAKAVSLRSGIEFNSLSDEDSNSDNSSDNSSDNNSNNSDGELRSSKTKKPNSNSNSKQKTKKKKQEEDSVGSVTYLSSHSSSSDVKTGKKKEKNEPDSDNKITSPRKKFTKKNSQEYKNNKS